MTEEASEVIARSRSDEAISNLTLSSYIGNRENALKVKASTYPTFLWTAGVSALNPGCLSAAKTPGVYLIYILTLVRIRMKE
jgi:hypothetical protein